MALFGTTFTMQGSLWGQLSGVDIVKPQADEIAFVGRAYQRILDTQRGHDEDTAGLRRIAAELQRRDGVEAILLAGTDLAVIFDEETAGFPCIDCARVHIDAIVEPVVPSVAGPTVFRPVAAETGPPSALRGPARSRESLRHIQHSQITPAAPHDGAILPHEAVRAVERHGVQRRLQGQDGGTACRRTSSSTASSSNRPAPLPLAGST